jgi:hypothetical protein
MGLSCWDTFDNDIVNLESRIDASLITEFLPNIAYFIADYHEKIYEDSLTALNNNESKVLSTGTNNNNQQSQQQQQQQQSSALISPSKMLKAIMLKIPSTPTSISASTTLTTSPPVSMPPTADKLKKSPPIVLKISTRKHEIVSSIKLKIEENDLCSTLLIYLVIFCIEINDWINLKVLLPAIKFPENIGLQFSKLFYYQFFNLLCDKSIEEQFSHDWFVTLIFDDFLLPALSRTLKSHPTSSAQASINEHEAFINMFYEHIYKFLNKIYPEHLTSNQFNRLIEQLKPKKSVIYIFTSSYSIHQILTCNLSFRFLVRFIFSIYNSRIEWKYQWTNKSSIRSSKF